MDKVIELFDGIKNVEFTEFTYCEEVKAELPVFTLTDIPAGEWNIRARIQNTKMFVEILGRQPKDYQEVLTWVRGMIPEETENLHQPEVVII
jgi:hypothetical protein